jgi:hypothetical protein
VTNALLIIGVVTTLVFLVVVVIERGSSREGPISLKSPDTPPAGYRPMRTFRAVQTSSKRGLRRAHRTGNERPDSLLGAG